MKYLLISLLLFSVKEIFAQTPIKLSSDQFKFTEGPVWDGSNIIYFTDIPNSKVIAYSLKENTFSEAFNKTNRGNGLILSKDNNILMCEGESGKITKRSVNGEILKTIVQKFNSKRFNAPNDLCMDSKGQLYFTDPTWGKKTQPSNNVYFLNTKEEISIVDTFEDHKPNGIIISPNGKYLYVNDSESRTIYRYEIDSETGKTSNRINFATLDITNTEKPNDTGADGMAIDTNGSLYITAGHTLQIINQEGKITNNIAFPEKTTNCTFGGKKKDILFVTAGKNLYKIDGLNVTGL